MRFLLFFFLLASCSSPSRNAMRIGIDANWYPLDFGPQTSYVNGFTEDLLVEMARYSGMEFEKILANWDSLLDGLREKKYDAVFTSLPPYEFNTAQYEFSSNFLALGPVLILPTTSTQTDLSTMDGHLIGIITSDPAVLVLEKHPAIIIRNYPTIPALLNAIVNGDIQGALLDRIRAVNFTSDLYSTQLKIASPPLTDKGLHLITLKGHKAPVTAFNKTLDGLKRKNTLDSLQKKWQLD